MKHIPSTEFIKKIGTYMEAAHREPLAVTRHGREWVIMLSPDEYQKMKIAAEAKQVASGSLASSFGAFAPENDLGAVQMALSIVNTSTRKAISADQLKKLIKKPESAFRAPARLLIEEVPERVLAGLVRGKAASWESLYKLAKWVGTKDHEKETFLRDMAGVGVGRPAAPGHSDSR